MWTRWTSNLKTDAEKDNFRRRVNSSKDVLDRVIEICEEKIASLDDQQCDLDAFNSPNWAYLQAAQIGRKGQLKDIIQLLTLDQKE